MTTSQHMPFSVWPCRNWHSLWLCLNCRSVWPWQFTDDTTVLVLAANCF